MASWRGSREAARSCGPKAAVTRQNVEGQPHRPAAARPRGGELARGPRPPQDRPGAAPAAHWLADLDQAINFDLDTLATDHALRRSQISQAGWTETHAKWLTRSHCAYQREGSTAPGADVPTTMRDGANPVAQTVGIRGLRPTSPDAQRGRTPRARRRHGAHDGRAQAHKAPGSRRLRRRWRRGRSGCAVHPVCVGDVGHEQWRALPGRALCLSGCAVVWDVPSPTTGKWQCHPCSHNGIACRATNRTPY